MRSPRPSAREKPVVQQRRPITTQKINKHNYFKKINKRTLTKSNQDAKDVTACSVMGTALSGDGSFKGQLFQGTAQMNTPDEEIYHLPVKPAKKLSN